MLYANHISIPLGIFIGLFASFIQSLGLTIQRKSHIINQSLPEHRQVVEHRRPLWWLGVLIFISSNVIGSLVQIASLPVVILAPLGAVSLLWNAFFARLLLGDVFSPWMILGTILIAGGAVLIAFFGIVNEETHSLEDLLALFGRPTFIAYFSVLGVAVFACLAITHLTEFSLARKLKKNIIPESSSADMSPTTSTIHLPATNLTTGLTDTLAEATLTNEQTPPIDPKSGASTPQNSSSAEISQCDNSEHRSLYRTQLFIAISYASFSGIISGMCLIFAKSGVELLLLTLGGKNQFGRWETWVLVLGLGVFALLQLWYLHKALILADPTLVCPSAFCFYNLSAIVNGLVYFDQLSSIPPVHLVLVVVGIVVLLAGVWVVSIQSGGGGVDLGSWTEEGVKLPGEDIALYSEPESIGASPSDSAPVTDGQQILAPTRQRISAVPMERETRSESHLPNISATLDSSHYSSTNTQTQRQHAETRTQLYSSPRTPSHRARLRPTTDLHVASPSSIYRDNHHHLHGLGGHSRTVSYPAPLSPPLGSTVSTLGQGFQIGLSPLSPGFSVLPLERRRRPSTMTQSGSSSDVLTVNESRDSVRKGTGERRRTISEGEVTCSRRTRDSDSSGEAHESNDIGNSTLSDPLASRAEEGHGGPGIGHQAANGRQRWRWLSNVFLRKN